ncbi:hypothetical protein [Vibrio crassostreae]|uniref:Uncharacterized protein n=1 Tax=Vibrio crassostreae TaxID=246167 RepID=A0A4V2V5C4_9VIBR|nr:hypothetical protein [Vibrio crassostreae]TCN05610.1 hypothetical protein EDB35_116108 [Vibrio crassostreae]TCT46253.1 hypothetical protein EDB39_114126 [Vibrio crassostreae]TCT54126.1 hypothetical protein EDB40_11412 [Vibrio crassostreae]TCT58993.1 hypothetical protein EDB44_118129 [Vibrio crassostreae]TCT80308.1 hypothetical protein EDB43_118129 [Vibrio crassostreae]
MNYCINCGERGALQPLDVPANEEPPFLELSEFGADNRYSQEQPVTILQCQHCQHEMIDLSS